MSITINRAITLATSQTKKFRSLVISKDLNDLLSAQVTFSIYCSGGNFIKDETLIYEDEAYNDFWVAFNNGSFLYRELVKNEEEFELPEDLEDEFIN